MQNLSKYIHSHDSNERKRAIMKLLQTPNQQSLELCQKIATTDSSPDIQVLAKRAVSIIQKGIMVQNQPVSKPAVSEKEQKFMNYLNGSREEKLSVIKFAINNNYRLVLPTLIDRLELERDTTVLAALLKAIGILGSAENVHHISSFIKHADPMVRSNALEVQQKLTPNIPAKSLHQDVITNKEILAKTSNLKTSSTQKGIPKNSEPVLEMLPTFSAGQSGQGTLADNLQPYASSQPQIPGKNSNLDQILVWGRSIGATDIHLSSGQPAMYRKFGLLKPADGPPFTSQEINALLTASGLDAKKLEYYHQSGDMETVHVIPGAGRFRISVMKHFHGCNITLRPIPQSIRSFEESGMPESCRGLVDWSHGLVLVTGPGGCGKTSTLATFVEMINQVNPLHVISIEKPIEVVFEPKKCQISQREVGIHTLSQNNALRGALREDPDILVVSELRDLDNIQLAVSAAETGHLVFGTMNTVNAIRTISRLANSFPAEDQNMLQNMLSESLRGIVCQQLVPRKDGSGVIPAYEVLIVTPAVANIIRREGFHKLASVMTLGKSSGMVTMDQSLMKLVETGMISGEEAFSRAEVKRDFKKFLTKKV